MNRRPRPEAPAPEAEKPTFDRPFVWTVAKAFVPVLLDVLGDSVPGVQEALRKGQGSRFDAFELYLMPDEAEAVWERLAEARRAGNEDANS